MNLHRTSRIPDSLPRRALNPGEAGSRAYLAELLIAARILELKLPGASLIRRINHRRNTRSQERAEKRRGGRREGESLWLLGNLHLPAS